MGDNLQDKLDAEREVSAYDLGMIAREISEVRESGIAAQAVGIGDPAPEFGLPNIHGREVRLGDQLARGPVVLAFYRGVW